MPKYCMHENCTQSPSYNIPTLKTPIYCKEHKSDDMIDVKSKRCIYENCTKNPSYNIPTLKTSISFNCPFTF